MAEAAWPSVTKVVGGILPFGGRWDCSHLLGYLHSEIQCFSKLYKHILKQVKSDNGFGFMTVFILFSDL